MNNSSIAILTWGLAGGSLANYTAALTKGFWDIGIKNITLLYIAAEPGKLVAIPEGVKIVPLGAKRARWLPIFLAKYLKQAQPDFLISVSAFINIPAIIGWLLSGKGSTKLIITQHATMSYKAYVELKHDWRVKLQPTLARRLYPLATGLHANSQAVLDDLIDNIGVSMPPKRTIATPNPINIKAIALYAQAEPEHPWLKAKQQPVILSVARLAKQKNFPLLLEAFSIVRQQLDAKLIIYGEGPERKNLEKLIAQLGIEQDVSLPGFSANPWSSMARADVFVLPSEEESFGLVLVEAMTCGIPIVATDAIGGGPKSVLEGGKYGILVPSQDKQALATAIHTLMTSPQQRDQLVAAGKQRCQAFSPEVIAQQWLSFLKNLM